MAALKTWAVSAPGGVQTTVDGRHSLGALLWPASGTLTKRAGRFPQAAPGFAVTATSPTPDGFVHVSPGVLTFMGTRSIAPYIAGLNAIEDINILAVPAHASLTRHDLIVAQQSDTLHADANNNFWVGVVRGTPAASPSDPAVNTTNGAPTNSPDYKVLARVVVPPTAAVNGILQANIVPLFTDFAVAVGGMLPVPDQTVRDAMTGTRYDGMEIYRLDRDWVEIYDGTAWRVQGLALCSSIVDRDAAITHPTAGTEAYVTGTRTRYVYDGTVWVADTSVAGRILAAAGTAHVDVAGTEVNITKLAIDNYRVRQNSFYIFNVRLYLSGGTAGEDFFIRVRKDTPLSGTVVADTPVFVPATAFDFTWTTALPWKAPADDTDADFYLSLQRVVGANSVDVIGDSKSAFWIEDMGGDSAIWSSVT